MKLLLIALFAASLGAAQPTLVCDTANIGRMHETWVCLNEGWYEMKLELPKGPASIIFHEAKLTDGGDFEFHSADGKANLTLKRSEKGDPIHELMATILIRAVSGDWELKDWREWPRKKESK
jgi:hypothetical protein